MELFNLRNYFLSISRGPPPLPTFFCVPFPFSWTEPAKSLFFGCAVTCFESSPFKLAAPVALGSTIILYTELVVLGLKKMSFPLSLYWWGSLIWHYFFSLAIPQWHQVLLDILVHRTVVLDLQLPNLDYDFVHHISYVEQALPIVLGSIGLAPPCLDCDSVLDLSSVELVLPKGIGFYWAVFGCTDTAKQPLHCTGSARLAPFLQQRFSSTIMTRPDHTAT